MTISTWVALIRNFLCVCKSLSPPTGFFHSAAFPTLDGKLSNATRLEVLIAITQLLAVYFNTKNGFWHVYSGIRDYSFFQAVGKRAVAMIGPKDVQDEGKGPAFLIVCEHIDNSQSKSIQTILTGIAELVVGLGFVVLFLNSLHIYLPLHPKPVIDALFYMEIALLYFLYLMVRSTLSALNDGKRAAQLADAFGTRSISTPVELHDLILDNGYPDDIMTALDILTADVNAWWDNRNLTIDDMIEGNVNKVKNNLLKFCGKESNTSTSKTSNENSTVTNDAGSSQSSDRIALRSTGVQYLRRCSVESYSKAPLEFVFFLLNLIAFYGYFLCVFAFYVSEQQYNSSTTYQRIGLFLPHALLDWWGNLAGDAMWTIDPLLAIVSPGLLRIYVDQALQAADRKEAEKSKKES